VKRLDVYAITWLAGTGIALGTAFAGLLYVAGIAAGVALAAFALVLFAPDTPDSDDIEALMRATREQTPDYVPAGWTEEYK
jgi:uncharacterized protein (DUF58 family)